MARDTVPAAMSAAFAQAHGLARRSGCWPRSRRRRPRAATSAGASRPRWSSSPPRASRGGGRSTCASRTHADPLEGAAPAAHPAARLRSRGRRRRAAGRGPHRRGRRALHSARPSSRPDSDELLFWAGLARAQAGDLEGGVAAVRQSGRGEPGLADPPRRGSHPSSLRRGRAARRVSRSPEAGTSRVGRRRRGLALPQLIWPCCLAAARRRRARRRWPSRPGRP